MKEVGILLLKGEDLTLDKAEIVILHETTMKMLQGKSASNAILGISCYSCGDEGHISRDCKRGKRGGVRPPGNNRCHVCGQEGHWAQKCSKRSQNRQWPSTQFKPRTQYKNWDTQENQQAKGFRGEKYGTQNSSGNYRNRDCGTRNGGNQDFGNQDYRRPTEGSTNYEKYGERRYGNEDRGQGNWNKDNNIRNFGDSKESSNGRDTETVREEEHLQAIAIR